MRVTELAETGGITMANIPVPARSRAVTASRLELGRAYAAVHSGFVQHTVPDPSSVEQQRVAPFTTVLAEPGGHNRLQQISAVSVLMGQQNVTPFSTVGVVPVGHGVASHDGKPSKTAGNPIRDMLPDGRLLPIVT